MMKSLQKQAKDHANQDKPNVSRYTARQNSPQSTMCLSVFASLLSYLMITASLPSFTREREESSKEPGVVWVKSA